MEAALAYLAVRAQGRARLTPASYVPREGLVASNPALPSMMDLSAVSNPLAPSIYNAYFRAESM